MMFKIATMRDNISATDDTFSTTGDTEELLYVLSAVPSVVESFTMQP